MAETTPYALREHVSLLFRYKRMILLVMISSALAALAVSYLSSEVYVSEVRILVQLNRAPLLIGSRPREGMPPVSSPQDQVQTEVEIIKSPEVARHLAQALGPDVVRQKMRWRWDGIKERLEQFKRSAKKALYEMFGREIVEKVPNRLDKAAIKLSKAISAGSVVKTDIFSVSFEAPDGEFAAHALNKLVGVYIDYHLQLRAPKNIDEVLADEVARLRDQLSSAEERLRSLKKKYRVVSISRQKDLLIARLNEVEANLQDARRMAAESDQRIAGIKAQLAHLAPNVQISSIKEANPAVEQIHARLVKLELERDQYVNGSPAAQHLDKEIRELRAKLKETESRVKVSRTSGQNLTFQELQKNLALEQSNRKVLNSRIELLGGQIVQLQGDLQNLDRHEYEVNNLKLETEAKRKALHRFIEKQEEVRLNAAFDLKHLSNVVAIGEATVPIIPERPRKKLNLILGTLAGLFFGVMFAYVAEYFRRTLANREEVEDYLGRQVIASVLEDDGDGKHNSENVVEFRRLALLVTRALGASGANVIRITSSQAGEGRSRVAGDLCEALAQQGKKVLLVEVSIISASNVSSGLENKDQPDSPAHEIERVGEVSKWVISGIPKDVGHALNDAVLRQCESFDYIVVDTPDLAAYPEQLSLAQGLQSVLFVLEANRTNRVVALKGIGLLEKAGADIVGVVLNKRRYPIPDVIYSWLFSPRSAIARNQ